MPLWRPEAELLRTAIASVLAQTWQDWELLIVEDPSESSGRDTLAEFDDSRIRHLVNPQRTSFKDQLNRGLAEARGELIARVDADDVCRPDRLEQQNRWLEKHPDVELLGSNLEVIDERGRHLGYRIYPTGHEAIVRAMRRYNPLAHPAVLFRKESIVAAGGYQTDMYTADYDLWCRMAQRGARFANHREPLLQYRVHALGMKRDRLREMLRATLQVKRRYWGGDMSLGDRTRYWGEQLLSCLPPSLIFRAFLLTQTVPRLPADGQRE